MRFSDSKEIVYGSVGQMIISGFEHGEIIRGIKKVILLDASGSMATSAKGSLFFSLFDVATQAVVSLQTANPGRILLFSFSDDLVACPNGIPQYIGASTKLAESLSTLSSIARSDIEFFLICDGAPNDPEKSLDEARKFVSKINAIFVGRKEDRGSRDFMKNIAFVTGGSYEEIDLDRNFTDKMHLLIGSS